MALRLPGYRITERLGKGGMAHVFLATQHSFERQVAIKILTPSLALEPRFAEQFMREARTVASLNHPHIVPVYDVGEYEGYYYLSMEYVTGGNLKQRIRNGMETSEAESVLRQLASALDYAGQHGFVHRDVKPDNIMFRGDGSALLMDFGIATNALRNNDLTQRNTVMGTPKYMSPEQHRSQVLTPQSDLYSLGCVFYEMLCGEPPYKAPDHAAMALAHLREPVPLLPLKLRHYQPLIRKLLAKDPADRPESGNDVIAQLETLERAPEHYSKDRARYRPQDNSPSAALTPRLRLKESKEGFSWRGNLYRYDVYLVADDFEQFQSHFPVLKSALMDWHEQRGSRCQSLTIKATIHPWISGRVKEYLKGLRQLEGMTFLSRLPITLNLVGSDGQAIERLEWQAEKPGKSPQD
ncbi:MAG: serine/threonine protein kinase [Pseudomonadales bacterium]|nr:serine/threonine protein kinase [Pseudomonadales bacterium]|tara:strand:- start:1997 stop:3226 length:1230 start_codon:yes stop_codon:yes gene_type:complete